MMNDSKTIKEKPWVYSIFFLIGILSFPLSIFFGAILASANILIFEGLFQLLFPLVICSILFAIVLRMTENWIVIDEGGLSYEIWNEGGKLNVYTQETRPYEIWKEEGRLNVYRNSDTASALLFKINEKYYEIGFMTP